MIETFKIWENLSAAERNNVLQRPALVHNDEITSQAADIVDNVRRDGDRALFDLTRRFDRCTLDSLRVSGAELTSASAMLPDKVKRSIDIAIRNVRAVHQAQIPVETNTVVQDGVRCERHNRPIDAVGLYVPSGSAPLPSTAVMLAVPALVAACPLRLMCTPPLDDGTVHPATLYAAQQSGVTDVFKIGGAQAIAAMAFGTRTVPKVNKIFGPGNAWVTAAKRIVANDYEGAAIDMPAGPSEVMVIADQGTNPRYAAADLLAQAEHGPDSQVVLITNSREQASAVLQALALQIGELKREQIIRRALEHSHVIVVASNESAVQICNAYGPEHLILLVEEPRAMLADIRNAGAVFIGPYSPEFRRRLLHWREPRAPDLRRSKIRQRTGNRAVHAPTQCAGT